MAELVSLRKGAKALGCALSTLQHHIRAGHVTLINGKVDVEVARIQLHRHTDQEQSMRAHQGAAATVPDPDTPAPAPGSPLWKAKEQESRTRNELLLLELAERRGELVKASDVEAAQASKITGLREMHLSIPDRLATILAAETDPVKVHELLTRELRAAMRALAAEAAPLES